MSSPRYSLCCFHKIVLHAAPKVDYALYVENFAISGLNLFETGKSQSRYNITLRSYRKLQYIWNRHFLRPICSIVEHDAVSHLVIATSYFSKDVSTQVWHMHIIYLTTQFPFVAGGDDRCIYT